MSPAKWTTWTWVGLLLLLGTVTASAQQPTGTIEGTVTDQSGAIVTSAKVTITEKATGRMINLTTNHEGYFVARSLAPGNYSVRVEQTGFAAGLIGDVVVQTGQVSNASLSLKVGAANEVLQVEGTAAQLQVDTSRQTIDGVVTADQIVQLPLNGRNFLDLAQLQPSVTVRDGGVIDPIKVNAYRAVTINGSSGTGTRVQIDGIDVTDETAGSTASNISTDAVEEFQLSRASFDLSTSLTTSGAVSIVSRRGGNEFHGSGFYFWRNEALGARLAFLTENIPFHRHQVGYRVGGPIIKNKLFFFSNWERTYQAAQTIVTSADFPQLNGTVGLPLGIRYTTNKLEWQVTDRLKLFYSHHYNDDLSTGGGGASPFQNVNWAIRHTVGADLAGAHQTHSFRFGYINFNNRIESQELAPFNFLRTPQGIPFYLGVGSFNLGPNSLAPQQTYQDNFQSKYDGSYVRGNHTWRYGVDINRIVLSADWVFTGPLFVLGLFNPQVQAALPAAQRTDPLAYPLNYFSTGPNSGFFTAEPAHNLPHGGHRNTRIAGYAGDAWRLRRNFTFNFGTRWEYDTGFFDGKAPELPILSIYSGSPKTGKEPEFPKTAFSPQVGFAWDLFGNGKTSVRGGFSLSYEMNINNNVVFDSFGRFPAGIGPESLDYTNVHGPDGRPIDVGGFPAGDYSGLLGQPIRNVIGTLGQVHRAVQNAYANFQFNPQPGPLNPSLFEVSKGTAGLAIFPGEYRIPYAMQFSIGFQRELFPHQVISVDYVRNRAVGLPFLVGDFERARAARTLDAVAARAQVAGVVGVPAASLTPSAIDTFLSKNPSANIGRFNLASDAIYTGLTRNITSAPLITGGFALYQGLQVKLDGRLTSAQTDKFRLIRDLSYTISYALARAEATSGSGRNEFVRGTINNDNWNSAYGPTPNDRTHILTAGALMKAPLGFNLNQLWSFRTARPLTLLLPFLDRFSSSNNLFTTDLNGDGRGDLLPGTNVGDFGRKIKSSKQLNQVISNFNANFAGKLTPAGQALVSAGIFTQDQLRILGATVKPVPLVPEGNPWPFENLINLDLRITRPIKLAERVRFEPSVDVFNVFNHTGLNSYGGLSGNFGALNYDYRADPQGRGGIPQLSRAVRGRQISTRLLQLGLRVTF